MSSDEAQPSSSVADHCTESEWREYTFFREEMRHEDNWQVSSEHGTSHRSPNF